MKYTEIGYFGPSTNVRDIDRSAPIADDVAASVLAALDRLPRRHQARRRSADIIDLEDRRRER